MTLECLSLEPQGGYKVDEQVLTHKFWQWKFQRASTAFCCIHTLLYEYNNTRQTPADVRQLGEPPSGWGYLAVLFTMLDK
jgi:hypothetical protein